MAHFVQRHGSKCHYCGILWPGGISTDTLGALHLQPGSIGSGSSGLTTEAAKFWWKTMQITGVCRNLSHVETSNFAYSQDSSLFTVFLQLSNPGSVNLAVMRLVLKGDDLSASWFASRHTHSHSTFDKHGPVPMLFRSF